MAQGTEHALLDNRLTRTDADKPKGPNNRSLDPLLGRTQIKTTQMATAEPNPPQSAKRNTLSPTRYRTPKEATQQTRKARNEKTSETKPERKTNQHLFTQHSTHQRSRPPLTTDSGNTPTQIRHSTTSRTVVGQYISAGRCHGRSPRSRMECPTTRHKPTR
jgi:hypothetical protein